MRDVMNGAMGWMMSGMGILSILVILALILGVAASVKYLFK